MFKIEEDQSNEEKDILVEAKYNAFRKLKKSPQKARKIFVTIGTPNTENTDKSESCFVMSPTWLDVSNDEYCQDRMDNQISLEAALAIRESRIANSSAKRAWWVALVVLIVSITSVCSAVILSG